MMSDDSHTGMDREVLARGDVMARARQRDGQAATVLSDEALLASRRAVIPDHFDGPLWVFGYGSLIWNPVIAFDQRIDALVRGYHRRFCMWTTIGRGSPDCPGLVLGLDQGGATKGQLFRIPHDKMIAEIDVLWRREMMADSYRPVWVKAQTEQGPITALSFAIRRNRPTYAPRLSVEETARIIHKAVGFVGPCRDYLEGTYGGLQDAGITDRHMAQLLAWMSRLDTEQDA